MNKEVESHDNSVDHADESVADSETQLSEDPAKTNDSHDDKNVLRSKTAALVVLGMAAVGLGLMIFFLTRGEEISDFEEQVSSNDKIAIAQCDLLTPHLW